MAFRRVGEASHPGPTSSIFLCANLTAAGSGWELVQDPEWDVGFFQETRQTHAGAARAAARRKGWQVISGTLDERGRDLVWIVVRHGAVMDTHLVLSPRLASAVWSPGGWPHFASTAYTATSR